VSMASESPADQGLKRDQGPMLDKDGAHFNVALLLQR
jgi:hypothetical protein